MNKILLGKKKTSTKGIRMSDPLIAGIKEIAEIEGLTFTKTAIWLLNEGLIAYENLPEQGNDSE